MSRRLLGLLISLVVLPLLMVLLVNYLLADPERYRAQITATIYDNTGYRVTLGDMSWRYWPPIALELRDVSVGTTAGDLATLERASLDLSLLPLLTDRALVVNLLEVENATLTAVVAEDGTGNWVVDTAADDNAGDNAATLPPTPAATDSENGNDAPAEASAISFEVNGLALLGVAIDYEDKTTASHYRVQLESLTSTRIAFDEEISFDLAANIEDVPGKTNIYTEAAGRMRVSSNRTSIRIQPLQSNNRIEMADMPPIRIAAELDAAIDLNLDTADISRLTFALPGFAAELAVNARDISAALPQFNGQIKADPFDANALLKNLGQPAIDTSNPAALSQVSLTAAFNGNPGAINVTNLNLGLDDTSVTGDLTVEPGDVTGLRFNLAVDSIAVDSYLPADDGDAATTVAATPAAPATNAAGTPATAQDSEVIPVDDLRSVRLDGALTIATLKYDTYTLSDVSLTLRNSNETLSSNLSLSGYDGTISNRTEVNYQGAPRTTNALEVRGINLTTLTEMEAMTGHVSMDASHIMQGKMLGDIMTSLDGRATFNVVDGTLDVTAIKKLAVIVDSLRGKTSEISRWPDQVAFKQLNGSHVFSRGTNANQVLAFTAENMTVNGSGGFDYFANTVAYDLVVNFKRDDNAAFRVGHSLANIDWPIHCEGNMDAGPGDLCFPDSGAVKDLLTEVTKQEVKRKGKKELDKLIEDKAPEGVRDVLKGLFRR